MGTCSQTLLIAVHLILYKALRLILLFIECAGLGFVANIMHAMTSIYKLHVDIKNTDTLQRLTFAHSVFSNLPCFSYYTHTYKDLPKNATSFCVVCVTGITTVAQKSIISIFIHYNQVFKLSLGGISEVPVTNLFLDACRGEN